MALLPDRLPIGELAARAGVATSALRYYESLGLIASQRTAGGQRRYARSMLRRIAFVRAGRQVGLTLDEVHEALSRLPDGRSPNKADWNRVSGTWLARIDERIDELRRLRATLDSCVGCGCLSLRTCKLYNPDDKAGDQGAGARWILGDTPARPLPPPRETTRSAGRSGA